MPACDRESPVPPISRLLTLAEVEALTGLSGATLRRAIRKGHLACLRFGRAIRITEHDYEAFLQRHRAATRRSR